MAKQRIKIPKKIEDDVMFKSQSKCYCGKQGDQIHHLDENPANNDFDNLIFLCFDHHDDASVKKGLKKRLNISQLKQRRNELYLQNDKKRDIELKHYSSTLKKITEENLFNAAFDAVIVLEILKIKTEFNNENENDWEKREVIIDKLSIYTNHSSLRISNEIFKFCEQLSYRTRGGMPVSFSDSIFYLIVNYFPHSNNIAEKKVIIEIAKTCCNIALGIIYDSFIYLGNMAIACSGLEILKHLYLRGQELKIDSITKSVLKQYQELEHHLNRPARTDLGNAKNLLKLFKDDLVNRDSGYPIAMSKEMYTLIEDHRTQSRQRVKK